MIKIGRYTISILTPLVILNREKPKFENEQEIYECYIFHEYLPVKPEKDQTI